MPFRPSQTALLRVCAVLVIGSTSISAFAQGTGQPKTAIDIGLLVQQLRAAQEAQQDAWTKETEALLRISSVVNSAETTDMGQFTPLVPLLIPMIGWGGMGRDNSRRAEKILARIREPALPALVRATEAPEARLRSAAARVIVAMHPVPEKATDVLIRLASDEDSYVRRASFEGLALLGEEARQAGPALNKALLRETSLPPGVWGDGTLPENTILCRVALVRVTGNKEPHVGQIVTSLKHDDPAVRQTAARALGDLGVSAASALSTLAEAIDDGSVGHEAKEAVRKIREASRLSSARR